MTIYSPESAPPPPLSPAPPHARGSLPPLNSPEEPRLAPRRPLIHTLRRHRLLLLSIFCILSSLVFYVGPRLSRTYDATGTMNITVRPFDPIPELAHYPEFAVKQLQKEEPIHAAFSQSGPSTLNLRLEATNPKAHDAKLALARFAGRYTSFVTSSAQKKLDEYANELRKRKRELDSRVIELTQQRETFYATRPDLRPDSIDSPVTKYNDLQTRTNRQEESRHRLAATLDGLREKKRIADAQGGLPAATPVSPSPPQIAGTPAPPADPENDREVLDLKAQLQLMNDLIDENLTRRTEQHPDVQKLRTQQVNLQKRLDAAKQRAAAGAPPPPVRAAAPGQPVAPAVDPSLLAMQKLNDDIRAAEKELNALNDEIEALKKESNSATKAANDVDRARHEYEKLGTDLDSAKADLQRTAAQLEQYNRRFPVKSDSSKEDIHVEEPVVEASEFTITSASTLPSSPSLSLIYTSAVLLGLLPAAGLALLLHRTDRTFHHPAEVATYLDLPVLGTVSEIRTFGDERLHRLWTGIGRPACSAGLVLVTLISAVQCYRNLANPDFNANKTLFSPPPASTAPAVNPA